MTLPHSIRQIVSVVMHVLPRIAAIFIGFILMVVGNPVYLRKCGASWGPQIGASYTDYFLLLMNDESVEGLMRDRFELGGEAAVAAGPVGRNAGANLKGVVVRSEDDLNSAVYDRTVRELLSDGAGAAAPSDGPKAFPEALGHATADAGSDR